MATTTTTTTTRNDGSTVTVTGNRAIPAPERLNGDAAKITRGAVIDGRAALLGVCGTDRWGHRAGMPRLVQFPASALGADGNIAVRNGMYAIRNGFTLHVSRPGGVFTVRAFYRGAHIRGYDKYGTAVINALFGKMTYGPALRENGYRVEYIGYTVTDENGKNKTVPGTHMKNSGVRIVFVTPDDAPATDDAPAENAAHDDATATAPDA